jgi:hypothetical protein
MSEKGYLEVASKCMRSTWKNTFQLGLVKKWSTTNFKTQLSEGASVDVNKLFHTEAMAIDTLGRIYCYIGIERFLYTT